MADFSSWVPQFLHQMPDAVRHRDRDGEVNQFVERVVEGVDGLLRLVPRYRQKLAGPVRSCLHHIDALVGRIPGPLRVSVKDFVQDPCVNAFFVGPEHIREVYLHSYEIQEFCERNPACGEIFCLLCMRREERTVFGIELDGDQLHRDVRQVAVSFHDHQLLAPATDPEAARKGLRNCIFSGLISHALGRISEARAQLARLERGRYAWRARLREEPQDTHAAQELEQVEGRLQRFAHIAKDPKGLLEAVIEILEGAEEYARVRELHLALDKKGILLPEGAHEPANHLQLAALTIGSQPERVVVLTSHPRVEVPLRDRHQFATAAQNFLNRSR